jgi:hypothetical protein
MTNKKRKKPIVRVTVGLDKSDHKHLLSLAKDADVSLAWMLRRATQEFLAGYNKKIISDKLQSKDSAV